MPLAVSDILQSALAMSVAWAVGDSTRRWMLRTERLAAKAVSAVAEERVRIAREMHDIVTHHMSVISLQAGVAEYVLDTDPPTAKAAIATVGDASREALSEMRRLLDVLRIEQDADPFSRSRAWPISGSWCRAPGRPGSRSRSPPPARCASWPPARIFVRTAWCRSH